MSAARPTVIPKPQIFPHLLPKAPQPYPVPLSRTRRVYSHFNARRDLSRELDELSDEEQELEELNVLVHNRGYNFLIPIGRSLTQQEEKNDASTAEEDSEDSGSDPSVTGQGSEEGEDGDNDSAQDLDASMDDMDVGVNTTMDTDDLEEDGDVDLDDELGSGGPGFDG